MRPKSKTCLACKSVFPIKDFYTYTRRRDGYTFYAPRCKRCENLNHRKRFDLSPEKRAIILFHSSKNTSKRRNIPFFLTKEDILNQYNFQHGKCYYTGHPMSSVSNDPNKMSIDRKDSTLGYTKENIVICCWHINIMKRTYSEREFLTLCKTISEFSSSRIF
jgi:hypothetical protein